MTTLGFSRALAAGLLVAAVSGPVRADEPGGPAVAGARAGFEAHVDPRTGELTAPPAAAPPLGGPTGARAARRLVAVPGSTAAGGEDVDLQGQFDSATVATLNADGSVDVSCTQPAPAPGD